jgi:hypothetical protein
MNEWARAAYLCPGELYQDGSLVSFRCADPDGYAIEVYWEASGAPLD